MWLQWSRKPRSPKETLNKSSASAMYKAQRVQAVAWRLKNADVAFAITPDFPFEV